MAGGVLKTSKGVIGIPKKKRVQLRKAEAKGATRKETVLLGPWSPLNKGEGQDR